MGPDTFKFFMAMGLPMLQLYGQTELGGIYCIQRRGEVDFDTVGRGFNDDYKIRIDKPDAQGVGEIVSQHPYMFEGYYKNEEATRADLREGWMHTGDAGYFKPSGQLVVIDRMRDLATTSSGERFSPQYIENKLKFSPYVSEAVVLGDKRAYLAAIVCIRFPIVSKWAEQNRMSFTTYSDLASRPEVYRLIAGRDRAHERIAAAGAAGRQVRAALQGARCRRRRAHPHAQGAPRRGLGEIRRHHRGDLCRQVRGQDRHRDRLPGRLPPAHPHDHADRRARDARRRAKSA